jgi:hypothetical protein
MSRYPFFGHVHRSDHRGEIDFHHLSGCSKKRAALAFILVGAWMLFGKNHFRLRRVILS